MRALILGADGFCGWAAALEFLLRGHEVHLVDSFLRRRIESELDAGSAAMLPEFSQRLIALEERFGVRVPFTEMDLSTDDGRLASLLKEFRPEVILDFAKIRSAPYSMRSFANGRATLTNNLLSTYNVAAAVIESAVDAHLIHIGTMGVYGYAGEQRIPEGLDFSQAPRGRLHSSDPGSFYHLSKVTDQHLLFLFHKTYGLKVTEYHQGIVWGFDTELTASSPELTGRWDYDGDYGTVLNRFLIQAVTTGELTVYGKGEQVRPFISLSDTVLALEKIARAEAPSFRIVNAFTQTESVANLAALVSAHSGAVVRQITNPRKELENRDYPADGREIRKLIEVPELLSEHVPRLLRATREGLSHVKPERMTAREWS